ncbi:MAG: hypothetical protein ACYDGR_06540 [Candidatus Dormibacteria bacterium]
MNSRTITAAVALPVLLLAACGTRQAPSSSPPSASASPSPQGPAGFAAHGFARVVATTEVDPAAAATVTSGEITVNIPAGAVTAKSRFDLLQGDNSYWQTLVPAGQKVLTNFAFRVVDETTNQLVLQFGAPVVAVYTDAAVSSATLYENTSGSEPPVVSANPVPAVISGTTLKHGNKADAVGWVIANPS